MSEGCETPVLFLVFNRPRLTNWVFQAIREAQPRKLYIAADGPRKERPDEAARCKLVREIVSRVDWPCEVHHLFRDDNLGCKKAVSGAIDWFFSHEEEGIILEDDILPDSSFFHFCAKMLAAHRNDARVMHVSGFNFIPDSAMPGQDYFFSRFGTIWGWATWRRAWRHYKVDLSGWRDHKKQVFRHFPKTIWKARARLYDRLANNEIDTWDYQWAFWRLAQDGLSIIPANNLVRNIGFGSEATHTSKMPRWADVATTPIRVETLRLNRDLRVNEAHDQRFLAISHESKPRLRTLFVRMRERLLASLAIPAPPVPPAHDWTEKLPLHIQHIGGMPPILSIGRGTYANGMKIYCWDPTVRVSFGKYCAVADEVKLIAGGEHHKDWVTSYQFVDLWNAWELYPHLRQKSKGEIRIGHDVWIGTQALILSGVTIGNGAVIGAGSLVVKDVPPYAIVGGNPANVIRYRFSEVQIKALQEIRWWDWPEKMIRDNLKLIHDVDLFIQTFLKTRA